jgi:hypothetical protein
VARVTQSEYPPSAGELAHAFASLASYTAMTQVADDLCAALPPGALSASQEDVRASLDLLSRVTGIANPPDPLTSITSYYETKRDRTLLWDNLMKIFVSKTRTTQAHALLAEAAQGHLAAPGALDYLIITTNYDCLMEGALDALKVPYVVLLTSRTAPQHVLVRFSESVGEAGVRERLTRKHSNLTPANFTLLKSGGQGGLVVLYKIHGCLNPLLTRDQDCVVISDNDYVNYISQMSTTDGVIPAYVTTLLRDKRFLFLGYSLSDWNVRSIFNTLRSKRGEGLSDFSVMRAVRDYERIFFERSDVHIVQADLNTFAEGVRAARPAPVAAGG